ncbi:MAG: hypothetical protein FWC10_06695 [Lentimicrobiaceae bacterium]|nr:hypothetical protein [Lentimicrobiaceae bacterium]
MRRRALLGSSESIPPIGKLLVDCPLNGDGLDISGNGNNLTIGSGVQWVANEGRQVFNANGDNSYLDLTSPTQGSYINNFRLEYEIKRIMSEPNILPNWVDGRGNSDGIIGQYNMPAGLVSIGFVSGGVEKAIWHQISKVTIGNWFRVIIQNKNGKVYIAVYDILNDTYTEEYTDDNWNVIIYPTYTFIRIGRNIITTGKSANAYLRNFKLWTNLV